MEEGDGPRIWYLDARWVAVATALMFLPFAILGGWTSWTLGHPFYLVALAELGILVASRAPRLFDHRRVDPGGEDVLEARVAGIERVRRGQWWRLRKAGPNTPRESFRTSARERELPDVGELRAPVDADEDTENVRFLPFGLLVTLAVVTGFADPGRPASFRIVLGVLGCAVAAHCAYSVHRAWRSARGSLVRAGRVELPNGKVLRRDAVRAVEARRGCIHVENRRRGTRTVLQERVEPTSTADSLVLPLVRGALLTPETIAETAAEKARAEETRAKLPPPDTSSVEKTRLQRAEAHLADARAARSTADDAHAAMLAEVEAEAEVEAAARVAAVLARGRTPPR